MSGSLLIKNRQRTIPLNTRLLRTLTASLLKELLKIEQFDLAIHIVRAPEMARLNEQFLQHSGSTDVITFDYSEDSKLKTQKPKPALQGEIFICIDDAIAQAREFRTSWQSEIARYVIHGILHLRGFDDIRAADRRKMKREENRLLKEVGRLFPLRKLASGPRLTS
ncbi:MAG TPA: rRNA maturation RNase YbeY [Verrucomicrobiae bacterium]|nr:rRNA maturation RNase YbeY [Verrucomicrobiae bacterium]